MLKLQVFIAALAFSITASFAQGEPPVIAEQPANVTQVTPPVTVELNSPPVTVKELPAAPSGYRWQVVSVDTAKPTFKERHPKIYKAAKKTRVVCHFALPIVQCGGAVAQILLLFI